MTSAFKLTGRVTGNGGERVDGYHGQEFDQDEED